MGTFFKPTDIVTMSCSVMNISRGGSAFAVVEDESRVFISPKLVDQHKIEIGDFLIAHCIENGQDDERTVRWRALRIEVTERFQPLKDAILETSGAIMQRILPERDFWTVGVMTADLAIQLGRPETTADRMKAADFLDAQFKAGLMAKAQIYDKGELREMVYAVDVKTLLDGLDPDSLLE